MTTPGLHKCVVHCGEKPGAAELEKLGAKLVSRAQRAGAVRRDVKPADVQLLVRSALTSAPPGQWRRYLDVVLDGLRARFPADELVRPQRARRQVVGFGPARFRALLIDDHDPQIGVNLFVLEPGPADVDVPLGGDQEGFLVLSGEALLIVDEEERPLRQWDYFHCPPKVPHTIVGAGNGPAAILAVGAANTAEATGAAIRPPRSRCDTTHPPRRRRRSPRVAYARFPKRVDASSARGGCRRRLAAD